MAWLTLESLAAMDFGALYAVLVSPRGWKLFGRLHVVAIHFPVALLMLAALLEMWGAVRFRRAASPGAGVLVVFGALGAVLAAATGWAHASHASYMDEFAEALWWHRWLGVGLAGLAVGVVAMRVVARRPGWMRLWVYRAGVVWAAVLVGVVGHHGGTLTHGPGFLAIPWEEVEEEEWYQDEPTGEPAEADVDGPIAQAWPMDVAAAEWELRAWGAGISLPASSRLS